MQSLGKGMDEWWRRPLSCAEGETEAPQVNKGGSRVSPRPPWGQELDLSDSTSFSPSVQGRCAEAEGVDRLLSMAPPEFLVHRASLLRGFPDSGVFTDLLRRQSGGGTEAAFGRCPNPTAPDGRKKRQEAVLGPGDPRAGWSGGWRASRSPHKVCSSKC